MKDPNFRWDLFLRDYRAFMNKQDKTLNEIGNEMGVIPAVLSGLRTGRLNYVGRSTIERILKYMKLYYEFYLETK